MSFRSIYRYSYIDNRSIYTLTHGLPMIISEATQSSVLDDLLGKADADEEKVATDHHHTIVIILFSSSGEDDD